MGLNTRMIFGRIREKKHEKRFDATIADYEDFIHQAKERTKAGNYVLAFDSGNFIRGSGLSDATEEIGKFMQEIIPFFSIDGLMCGENELGSESFVNFLRKERISSRNIITGNIMDVEDWIPLTNAFLKIPLENFGSIGVLSFLSNKTTLGTSSLSIISPINALNGPDVRYIMTSEDVKLVVVEVNMGTTGTEVEVVRSFLRGMNPYMPLVIFCGGTYREEACVNQDNMTITISSGFSNYEIGVVQVKLVKTIISEGKHNTNSSEKSAIYTSNKYSFSSQKHFGNTEDEPATFDKLAQFNISFLPTTVSVLQDFINKLDPSKPLQSWETENGSAIRTAMEKKVEELKLNKIIGCNKRLLLANESGTNSNSKFNSKSINSHTSFETDTDFHFHFFKRYRLTLPMSYPHNSSLTNIFYAFTSTIINLLNSIISFFLYITSYLAHSPRTSPTFSAVNYSPSLSKRNSIQQWMVDEVLPAQQHLLDSKTRLNVSNTAVYALKRGSITYHLFEGEIDMDDVYMIDPGNTRICSITNITNTVFRQLLESNPIRSLKNKSSSTKTSRYAELLPEQSEIPSKVPNPEDDSCNLIWSTTVPNTSSYKYVSPTIYSSEHAAKGEDSSLFYSENHIPPDSHTATSSHSLTFDESNSTSMTSSSGYSTYEIEKGFVLSDFQLTEDNSFDLISFSTECAAFKSALDEITPNHYKITSSSATSLTLITKFIQTHMKCPQPINRTKAYALIAAAGAFVFLCFAAIGTVHCVLAMKRRKRTFAFKKLIEMDNKEREKKPDKRKK
eukprot:MONOS_5322.1-p1 / transcript=MONOS_5322.1 / gene=MONOS_5322 / organism=Monocercomonoides_exilis_PA203 / gene_product=unspecified product / transcript_product=unspecified product / location=Mono_scaffold00153:70381-73086(-) / protein_length=788 / sequence_SO=supercontig / SO=protein_coding / is_pseudo=false